MRTVSINSMVQSVSGMLDTGDLTEWEEGFVESVWVQSNHGKETARLSEKQVDTVERIYRKHFA